MKEPPGGAGSPWLVAGEGLPEDVRDLIVRHIDSISKLEILLLLGRHPDVSPEGVASELRMAPQPVRERLDELVKSRLAARDGDRYRLREQSLQPLVDRLADSYAKRRVSVVEFVISRPSDSLSTFSDAFKFRRKK